MRLIFYNIRYTIIRGCNARNKYNNVTTTLFTDAIWPNKVKKIKAITDFINPIPNYGELDGLGKCTIFKVIV